MTGSEPIMPALEALLQQTANMAAQADPLGLPSIERGVGQLAEATARLAKRSTRAQQGAEALAAARILASEGIDAQMLNKDIRGVEIQPTLQEVMPETCSLDEWMTQVQELSLLSAARESQKSTQDAFSRKLDDMITLSWQTSRSKFVTSAAQPVSSYRAAMPGEGASSTPVDSRARDYDAMIGPMAALFVPVVQKVNRSKTTGVPYDAIRDVLSMNRSSRKQGRTGTGHTSLQSLWQVVESVLSASRPGARVETGEEVARVRAALCASARRHLEGDYSTYVGEEIGRHLQLAMLGGSPSRLQQVRAFLRVRFSMDRSSGVGGDGLDFDTPGGVDTFWHQLYYCLRCGYVEEALQLAETAGEGSGGGMGAGGGAPPPSLADYLREWHENGELSASNQAMVRLDGERLLREHDRSHFGKNQYRLMIYTILCADRHLAESMLADQFLFTNIEDFLWFKLVLVREGQLTRLTSSPYTHEEPYRLAELQQQLAQYPSSYYTREGKEPLLYVVLLLLTLQFGAAVQYLAGYAPPQQPGQNLYLVQAVHLCIVLEYYGMFSPGIDPAVARGRAECSDLIHEYGQHFVRDDPATAFEYYCLSADVRGGGLSSVLQRQGHLLRELLSMSRAFGTLLGAGGGGSGALLSKLKPNKEERAAVITAAALGCMQNAQFDEAIELFMHADKPLSALEVINKRYADSCSLGGETEGLADDMEQRGEAAIAALGSKDDIAAEAKKAEVAAFEALSLTRKLFGLFRESEHQQCLQVLSEYAFLPVRAEQVSKYAQDAHSLHIVVKEKLPQVVKLGGMATYELIQERRSAAVSAHTPPSRLSSSTHELKARLHALALYAGCVKIIPENIATEMNILLNTV